MRFEQLHCLRIRTCSDAHEIGRHRGGIGAFEDAFAKEFLVCKAIG